MFLVFILLPFVNFVCLSFFGRFLSPKGSIIFCLTNIFFSLVISFVCLFEVAFCRAPCFFKLANWVDCELLDASWGGCFDSLSTIMCSMVLTISFFVHVYSISYMSHDPHQSRFMSYLSLFTFFMLMLVVADNFIQLFFGWEGVGLCSYLLINFWFTRLQANKAAIKAMIINRVGDLGLALAICILFNLFKTVDFSVIFSISYLFSNFYLDFLGFNLLLLDVICCLLFIGSIGKSAQLGLHTWLPDAMEGPTPVSALIHAATMVTAGVFIIIRCSPLFEISYFTLNFISFWGALTALISATIGLVQNDLKKVIAYSTCSQLGYMIFACGLSNYNVSLFHLVNHAYFKALLFLSAGSIIHALNDEQDMRKMGGLLQVLPFTYMMIFIGSLSLMGFPFLTGFYSKDLILETAFAKYCLIGHFSFWLGLLSATFTAFYSFRLIFLTFLNNPNGFKVHFVHVHDAPLLMTFVLSCLCCFSIFLGFVLKDFFVGVGNSAWNNSIFFDSQSLSLIDAEFIPLLVKLLPFCCSLLGSLICMFLFLFFKKRVNLLFTFLFFYIFLSKKWFFDKLQNDFIGSFFLKFGYGISFKRIDKGFLEILGPKGIIFLFSNSSKQVSMLHSGILNQYTFLIFFSIFCFIATTFKLIFITDTYLMLLYILTIVISNGFNFRLK